MNAAPKHVAIILDGNGRWAKQHNKERTFGHIEGIKVLLPIAKVANELKIKYLSVFAFSTENWNRPKKEVNLLWKLPAKILKDFKKNYLKENIKIKWIGFKDKIPDNAIKVLEEMQNLSKECSGVQLNICMNYGGKQDIVYAANKLKKCNQEITLENLNANLLTNGIDDVDLIIRTSGEQRISNFLLWQAAYAEYIFEPTLWPDYNEKIFLKNIDEYQKRNRRFGKIKE